MADAREGSADTDLVIRPPLQQRSRAAWQRILDAGVEILERDGYEGFTIAAVCEQARVSPPALYARTTSKDALFLAVYEHGAARLQAEQAIFTELDHWYELTPAERIRHAVSEVVHISLRHSDFLRAAVLTAAAHPEVRRRGSDHSRKLGELFSSAVLPAADAIRHADRAAAVSSCFGTVFAATMIRIAFGQQFAASTPVADDEFVAAQEEAAVRYLLAGPVD